MSKKTFKLSAYRVKLDNSKRIHTEKVKREMFIRKERLGKLKTLARTSASNKFK